MVAPSGLNREREQCEPPERTIDVGSGKDVSGVDFVVMEMEVPDGGE